MAFLKVQLEFIVGEMAREFQRKKVYEQVAQALEERIGRGEWDRVMPSERWLSVDLGVSRDQVHAAILSLRARGVLGVEKRRNVIVLETQVAEDLSKVVVLTSDDLQQASHGFLHCVDALRRQLKEVDVQSVAALGQKSPGRSLERLVAKFPGAVWVLHRASVAAQRWFSAKGLPAVVLGSTGVALESIDLDHHAAARHAVGRLQAAGHHASEILFVRPEWELEGVARMERGYREVVEGLGGKAVVMRYRDLEHLKLRVSQLLEKGVPLRAMVVTSYKAASLLPGWLAYEYGVYVGRDLSLICLSDGPSLAYQHPAVAYYAMAESGLSRKLVQRVEGTLKRQEGGSETLVMPEFVRGASVIG
ncbi:GntR family transcriptional regulator [Rubritalea tangerina]|uniref:GntR family transcriptional regulator n=1 Tax=Rubritalea tangerina TaxID=430798 RepID=A0ABW4ZG47_9BACT